MTNKKTWKGRTITGLILLVLFAGISILGFIFYNDIYLPEGWCQSRPTDVEFFNDVLAFTPRLVGCIQTLFVALLALYIGGFIFKKIFKGTPRRVTVGKLVNSIFRVVVWVAAAIAILAVWGVNVGALIAGAGVLTLVVGLGMQSLIADVIAGIFLVCDGTLEVGDIITIDNWRGTVQEIGIRTTKLVNYSGDIRVCTNSTITTFINQSREKSYPIVYVGVPYGENLYEIEKLFKEKHEELKARLPRVISGPDFMGVHELAASSIDLQFGATCKEEDFFQVQRDMRGVIKQFLEENGISIPFPQIVLHTDKGDPVALHTEKEEK